MTIAYQYSEQDGRMTGHAAHNGHKIQVNAAYDIAADKFGFHVYVDQKKLDRPLGHGDTLRGAIETGLAEAIRWIDGKF